MVVVIEGRPLRNQTPVLNEIHGIQRIREDLLLKLVDAVRNRLGVLGREEAIGGGVQGLHLCLALL